MALHDDELLETEEFYKRYEDRDYREREGINLFSKTNIDKLITMFVSLVEDFEDPPTLDHPPLTNEEKKIFANIFIDWYNEEDPKLEKLVSKITYVRKHVTLGDEQRWNPRSVALIYLLFHRILLTYFDYDIFWSISNPSYILDNVFHIIVPTYLIPEEIRSDPIFENYLNMEMKYIKRNVLYDIQEFPALKHSFLELYRNVEEYEKSLNFDLHFKPIDDQDIWERSILADIIVYIGQARNIEEWQEKAEIIRQRKEKEFSEMRLRRMEHEVEEKKEMEDDEP